MPENCAMRSDFPEFRVLYSTPERRHTAKEAAIIEAYGYGRWTRLDEVGEYCRRMDFTSVGIGYCPDMAREAKLTADYLQHLGVDVVLPSAGECDPAGQAGVFNAHGTQFNVIAGMCVGHDSLFVMASRAGVTCLVARDTFLQHNPAGATYASHSYYHPRLFKDHAGIARGRWEPLTDMRLYHTAEEVAREGKGRWTRIEEVIEFAHRLGATRLGLSFCHGLREEAKIVDAVLQANGFDVRSVGCKAGAVPKEELEIIDSQKVHPGHPEMICNSLAQAELLNAQETQLNISMGQCVGHDATTMKTLKTPVVCLIAKDRVLAHNTVGALYAWEAITPPVYQAAGES